MCEFEELRLCVCQVLKVVLCRPSLSSDHSCKIFLTLTHFHEPLESHTLYHSWRFSQNSHHLILVLE